MSNHISPAFTGSLEGQASDWTGLKIVLLGAALITATLFFWPLFAITEFDYPHAWVSAHFSTMARAFAEHGVAALGGVPIQNNSPITSEPDFYIHWPPFGPIALGWAFSIFRTDGEFLVHATSLALVALQVAMLFLWLRRTASTAAAAFGALVLLNAPIMVKYGHVWLHLHLALLLAFAACLMFHRAVLHPAFERRTLALGCLLYSLACFTTWEPILAWPGLAIYAAIFRSRRALIALAAYGAAGALSVFGTFALYAGQVDGLATRLMSRALFRAGMADFSLIGDPPVHELANFAPEISMSWPRVLGTLLDRLNLLGAVGMFALIFLLILVVRRRPQFGADKNWLILAPLLAMWGLWFALMPQHAFIHEYQFVLGALPVALAGGFIADRLRLFASASAAKESARAATLLRAAAISVPVCLVLLRLPYDYQKYREFRPERNEGFSLAAFCVRRCLKTASCWRRGTAWCQPITAGRTSFEASRTLARSACTQPLSTLFAAPAPILPSCRSARERTPRWAPLFGRTTGGVWSSSGPFPVEQHPARRPSSDKATRRSWCHGPVLDMRLR